MSKDTGGYISTIIFISCAMLFALSFGSVSITEERFIEQREYVRLLELRHDLMVINKPAQYSKRFDEIRETCNKKFWFIIEPSLPDVIPNSYANHYKEMTSNCMQIYFEKDFEDMEKLREINEGNKP